MATPTYTALATTTLASSASSVTFSNIPQGYRDLVVIARTESSSDTTVYFRMNNDSGTNYSVVRAHGDGSSALSNTYSGSQMRIITSAYTDFTITANIQDYSASDKHTTVVARQGNAGELVGMTAGRWADTSPVTSLYIFTDTSSWNAGSTFSLYGIEA